MVECGARESDLVKVSPYNCGTRDSLEGQLRDTEEHCNSDLVSLWGRAVKLQASRVCRL